MSTQPEISDSASCGALALLRIDKAADFAKIHSGFLRQDGVAASIPVLGDWNILLRLAAKDPESLKQLIEKRIRSVEGVKDFEAYNCEEIWTADSGSAEYKASAYAILDVDSSSLSSLTARLRTTTGVAESSVIDNGKKIILFLRGNSPREIRKTVSDEIRPLRGVLRIKLLNAMY